MAGSLPAARKSAAGAVAETRPFMFCHAPPWFSLLLLGCAAIVSAEVDAQVRTAGGPSSTTARSSRVSRIVRQYASQAPSVLDASEAQMLVDAPITRHYQLPRNYGPTDVGGRGTAIGSGISQVPDEAPTIGTIYGGYDSYFGWPGGAPSALAYSAGFAPSLGGGPVGLPIGIRSGIYHPRYFAPYWYAPLRTGYWVYNPNFFYGNSYYGGYSSPFYTGFGGFGFPYSFGAYRSFGYPYSYGVYGYPYYNYLRPSYAYTPTYAYFMYPGQGALYVPPGFYGFPGYYGYGGYGMPLGNFGYGGAFYW